MVRTKNVKSTSIIQRALADLKGFDDAPELRPKQGRMEEEFGSVEVGAVGPDHGKGLVSGASVDDINRDLIMVALAWFC